MDEEIGIAPTSDGVNDYVDVSQARCDVDLSKIDDEFDDVDPAISDKITTHITMEMELCTHGTSRGTRKDVVIDLIGDGNDC